MVSLTLKNIPPDLHRKLKAQAAKHGRSLNKEAIMALREATAGQPVDVEAVIARARKLRERISVRLDDETLRRFKNEGRK
ncbi:MAG: toxin-antitoxin system HicB family antitoxin [Thermoanaerobaculia bacterium]